METTNSGYLSTLGGVTGTVIQLPSPPLFGKIALACVCAFGFAGNILIIFRFTKSRALFNPPNLFIINLALADLSLMFCLGPLINNMVAYEGRQGYGSFGCLFHAVATITAATTSLVTMGLIAFSRYITIVHPRKKALLSWSICGFLSVASWVYAIALLVPAFFGWGHLGWVPKSYHCTYDWTYNMIYNAIIFLFAFGLVSLIICFCYYNIYKVFRESKRRVAGEGAKMKGINKDELRLAIQLLVVFVIYNMTWGPYFITSLFIDPQGQGPEWLYCILLTLVYWNSAVNVLVYMYYNTVFRAESLQLVGIKPSKDSVTSRTTASTSLKTEN